MPDYGETTARERALEQYAQDLHRREIQLMRDRLHRKPVGGAPTPVASKSSKPSAAARVAQARSAAFAAAGDDDDDDDFLLTGGAASTRGRPASSGGRPASSNGRPASSSWRDDHRETGYARTAYDGSDARTTHFRRADLLSTNRGGAAAATLYILWRRIAGTPRLAT